MAESRTSQLSMTGGIISKTLYGRKDLARYAVSCKQLMNGYVRAQGGIVNRPGLKFVAEAKTSSEDVTLRPFESAGDEAFVLEFGDEYMRAFYQGAVVMDGESPFELTTPYTEDNIADLYISQSNDVACLTHPLHPPSELARYGSLDWSLTPLTFAPEVPAPESVAATRTQGYTEYGADRNPVPYTYKVAAVTPEGQEGIPSDEATSAALVMGYEANYVTISWDSLGIREEGDGTPSFTYSGIPGTTYPIRNSLENDQTITHIGYYSNNSQSGCKAKIGKRVSSGNYEIEVDQAFNHPGGGWYWVELDTPWEVPSSGTFYVGYYSPGENLRAGSIFQNAGFKSGDITTDQSGFTENSFNSIVHTQVRYAAPGADVEVEYYVVYKENNGLFGYIGETPDGSFKDDNISPNLTITPQDGYNPFESPNYPRICGHVQQRRLFASSDSQLQTVWMSQSGNYRSMSRSKPARDSDAIEFTLASRRKEDIYHVIAMEKGMLLFTRSGEWRVTGRDGDIMTPSSLQPEPQSEYGCAKYLKPIIAGERVLFPSRSTKRVYEMEFSLAIDRYKAIDLTLLAEHLFKDRTIVAWDYVRDQEGIIWCVMDDGTALSLTYLKDQEVWGWGQQQTEGKFLDVCVVPEGDRDVPYFLVHRRIGGTWKKFVEYMSDRDFTDIRDCFFVDSGLSLDNPVSVTAVSFGAATTLTSVGHGLSDGDTVEIDMLSIVDDTSAELIDLSGRYIVANKTTDTFEITTEDGEDDVDTSAYSSTGYYDGGGVFRECFDTVSGLDHLEGKAVVALCDGEVVNDLTVSSGAVSFASKHARVHVGLPYQTTVETLDLINQQGDDTGIHRAVGNLHIRIDDTLGIKIGFSAEDAIDDALRETDGSFTDALMNGLYEVDIVSDWDHEQNVFVIQENPLPMGLLGFTLDYEYGGP